MVSLEVIAEKIIREQELVIGPLAWREASKVDGINVDALNTSVRISAPDQKQAIDGLVARYERLFGRASHEVCKDAVATLVATMQRSDVPVSLLS